MQNNTPKDVILLGTQGANGAWTGVSDDETTSVPVLPQSHTACAIAIIGNGTIASGNVVIEEAYYNGGNVYDGTWSQITAVTASNVSGGKQQIVHIAPNALFPIRVRIETAIGGGGGISAVLRYQ